MEPCHQPGVVCEVGTYQPWGAVFVFLLTVAASPRDDQSAPG
jgi:hypothetical protein